MQKDYVLDHDQKNQNSIGTKSVIYFMYDYTNYTIE